MVLITLDKATSIPPGMQQKESSGNGFQGHSLKHATVGLTIVGAVLVSLWSAGRYGPTPGRIKSGVLSCDQVMERNGHNLDRHDGVKFAASYCHGWGCSCEGFLHRFSELQSIPVAARRWAERNDCSNKTGFKERRRNMEIPLSVNPDSILASDIVRVWHEPAHRKVHFLISDSASVCPWPVLRIRLSGASLAILVPCDSPDVRQLSFTYGDLDPGVYFLETVMIMCNKYDSLNVTECLPDIDGDKITRPYSFMVREEGTTLNFPRWVNTLPRHAQQPLKTREQSVHCNEIRIHLGVISGETFLLKGGELLANQFGHTVLGDPNPVDQCACIEEADTSRFDPYVLKNGAEYTNPMASFFSRRDKSEGLYTLCMVGDSHTSYIEKQMQSLVAPDFIDKLEVQRRVATFPEQIFPGSGHFEDCNMIVVGLGQWPASFKAEPYAYDRNKYKKTMAVVFAHLHQLKKSKRLPVFVKSVNYNPRSARIGSCPPVDWRRIPFIDVYNEVLKELSLEYKVALIDLHDIVSPMWDSAIDWCHYKGKVFKEEAKRILATIFTAD